MYRGSKERSTDRILSLRPIEGLKTKSSVGAYDSRLFTGDNKLHAIMDQRTCLWYLKYEAGGLQEPLKQRFTNFKTLLDFTTEYFKRRNIEIKEIID